MDFSLDVSEEWLKRRRELTAQASRKVRQKKKQEREVLLEENKDLRKEQAFYAAQISELQRQVEPVDGAELSRENELLREELEKHKTFLSTLFVQMGRIDPCATSSMGELSKSNRENTMLHFLRILDDSQNGLKWKVAKLEDSNASLQQCPPVVLRFHKPTAGGINLRMDIFIDILKASAQTLRDAMSQTWEDKERFANVFGENYLVTSRELTEFRVENETEVLKAFYRRTRIHLDDHLPFKFKDMVFLIAKGTSMLAKSTLGVLDNVEKKRARFVATAAAEQDPFVGLTQCFYAMRSVTEHGKCPEDEDEELAMHTTRLFSTLMEGVFVWEDEAQSCASWMVNMPPSFESEKFGKAADFIHDDGTMPERSRGIVHHMFNALLGHLFL